MSFGSLSVIPPELAQKFSFTAAADRGPCHCFEIRWRHNDFRAFLDIALRPSQCLLLFLFLLVTGWVTYFMPRKFLPAQFICYPECV